MSRANTATVTSSTIAQPVGSQPRSSILTRASQGIRQLFFTAADLADPTKLFEVIHRLQSNLLLALRPLTDNPTLGGNLLSGVVFTAGQTRYLPHNLGHAYRGFYCVRAQTNPPLLVEAALPTGVSSSDLIAITSTNAGTYSLWVF